MDGAFGNLMSLDLSVFVGFDFYYNPKFDFILFGLDSTN